MSSPRLVLTPQAAKILEDDPALRLEAEVVTMSFGEFVGYWTFRSPDSSELVRLADPWPGQREFIGTVERHDRVFALKARKQGFSTLETAFDAWVALIRPNARVHLFSRGLTSAQDLLERVAVGLSHLPPWLAPPITRHTTTVLELGYGEDLRVIEAYPTSAEGTSAEQSCTHAHLDELVLMENPERVWQSVHPTLAGSAHILTTGRGPGGFAASFWRRTVQGDTEFVPLFVPWTSRSRDPDWERRERRNLTELQFAHEHPSSWQDALSGGGDRVFEPADLDHASELAFYGRSPAIDDHRYITAWDIGGPGLQADASVGTVLDVSDPKLVEVVQVVRRQGVSFPALQEAVERLHGRYPGPTVIEATGIGAAVAGNLDIPQRELIAADTNKESKPQMIGELQFAIEKGALAYSAKDFPLLHAELRDYQHRDEDLTTDHVMSLAIAYHHAAKGWRGRRRRGRLGPIIEVA